MRKFKNYFIILLGASMLASCTTSGPLMVTNNKIVKRGVAERKIFFNITFGHTDLGIATAAKNGGITKVATVDYSVTGGLFTQTYRVVVTGE